MNDYLTQQEITDALSFISPDCDRMTWTRVGMAIQSEIGDTGFDIWDSWSQGSGKYSEKSAKEAWRSFKPGGKVTIATMLQMAINKGWTRAKPDMSDDDRAALAAQRKADQEATRARQAAQAAEDAEKYAKAAATALKLWSTAIPVEAHPYLDAKGIRPAPGMRVGPWTDGHDALVIPLCDATGAMKTAQAIFPDGTKKLLYGGEKSGASFTFGSLGNDGTIVIAEGMATAASIHAATGFPTVMAIDSGNLPKVAQGLRKRFPEARIIIAADNDQWTDGNPGMAAAEKAAKLSKAATLVKPTFKDIDGQPTDFNDLHKREGLEAVKAAFFPVSSAVTSTAAANDNHPVGEFEAAAILSAYGIVMSATDKGQIHPNQANAVEVLNRHPMFAGKIWYDSFFQEMMTCYDCATPRKWTDGDRLKVARIFQRQLGLVKFADDLIEKAAMDVAFEHGRDSLTEWLLSLKWDGVPRLDGWLSKAVGAPRDAYHDAVGTNFMISLVARGIKPGCKVDTMPVFEGAQGTGKSTLLAILGGEYFAELTESPESKDFFVGLQGKWLIEIAELDAFRKADVTRIKQVLSTTSDHVRLPYAKRAIDIPRRVVFAGTTNQSEYLRDSTGARRFWPVMVHSINLQWLTGNREQLFAEAAARYKKGEAWHLVNEAEAKAQTDARREGDPWDDSIAEYCVGRSFVRIDDVFAHLGIDIERRDRRARSRIADVLKSLGSERSKKRDGGKVVTAFENKAVTELPF